MPPFSPHLAVIAASAYSTTVLGDGPAAYWRLGETTGTSMADATANANNGTYSAGATLGQPGALQGDTNTAVSFDGTTGAASVPNSASLQVNKVTIELWVKKISQTNYGMYVTKNFVSNGAAGSGWFELMNNGTSGKLEFRVTGDQGASLISSGTLALSTWYYVAATYDGTTAKLYINGSLDSSLSITATPTQTTDPLYLARRSDGYYNNAVLDEVAIYPAALSATQVAAHWQAAGYVPGAPTGVTASIPTGTSNQAKVTWTAPIATGTSAITSYTITPHVGAFLRTPTTVTGSPPATSVTLTGLSGGPAGTTYTFTVVATNASGNGAVSSASNSVSVTGAAYPYAGTVLTDSPAAYWRLGETSGTTATDITGSGLNGTYSGGYTLGQTSALAGGDPDPAVSLDGKTGAVSIMSDPKLQVGKVTIELWVKKLANTSNGMYVTKNYAGGGGVNTGWFQLMNDQGGSHLEFRVTGDIGTSLDSSASLALNTWYYVAATYDGSAARIYINGALDSVLPITATATQTSDPLYIGRRADGYYNNAVIDEFAIYSAALTASQVATHWQAAGYVPGAPTGVSATGGSNQATVSWAAPTSAGSSAITGYTVTPQVGSTLRTPVTVSGSTLSTTVTNLSSGSYTFSVVATNSSGSGPAGVSSAVSVTGASYPYATTILNDAPLGYWRLGEASGTLATDATGNGNAGTYTGGITLNQTGAVLGNPDPAVTVGSTGYVDVNRFPGLKPASGVSVEAWINPSSTPTGAIFASPEQSNTGGYVMTVTSTGHIRMNVSPSVGNWNAVDSITAPASGKWTHVAGTWDGSTIRIYVNGQLEASQADTTIDYGSSNQDALIGRYNGTSFSGGLDEVAVYDHALTATQVVNHWAAGGYSPGAPTGVSATGGTNQAVVSWTAPAYQGPGTTTVSGYTVLTQGGPTQIVAVSATASPVTVTGLSGGSSYSFTVVAKNSYGSGPPSAASNAVTPTGAALPGAPSGVTATGGNAQATVSWTAPSDGGSPITSYTVTPYIGTAAQTATVVSGTPPATTVTITGLLNTTYTFQVYATNGVGNGPAGVSNAVTPTTVPGAPAITSLTAGNGSVTLQWSTPASNGSAITGYTITTFQGTCCGTPAPGIAPVTVGVVNSATITGLTKEVSYSFQVYATNANGNGPPGTSGIIAPYGPAGPPGNVRAVATAGGAIVSWTAPTDNGGSTITTYTITPIIAGTPATATTIGTNVTSTTITGLTGGASYSYSVVANNAAGAGASGSSSVVVASTPLASGNGFNSLTVSVGYAQNNPGGPGGFTPTPWQGSAGVNFVGQSGPSSWDTGAIRIDNSSSTTLTLSGAAVDIAGVHFNLWGTSISIPANSTTILTQMGDNTLDTSDTTNPNCNPSGVTPTVTLTMSGTSWTYYDTQQVLNTGGFDQANCQGRGESHQWQQVGGGPSPAELAGAGDPNEHHCNCHRTQFPVNDASGNFWHTYTDLLIPGRGIPLAFTRTYNSLSAGQDGPLGFGWADKYNAFLTADVSGSVAVHEENGGVVSFAPVGSAYQAPSRVLATLVRNGDGSFTFTNHDKSTLGFNSAGQLTAETDRNGYKTSFAYNTAGLLTTLTDPAGRTLTLGYGTNGKLASVTDNAGTRTVAFGYDASGNLKTVTDVAGGITTFGYDANHLLQTITDPNTGVVTNTYDTAGRVTQQQDPQLYKTLFSYGASSTTITDPNGNVTVEQYQNNELVSRTEGSGTPQAATWSYTYDQATLGIATTTDPNQHVWSNKWDASGNLLTSTDPLSRTTTYTYNSFNEVLTAQDPLIVTTTYAYDGSGNLQSVSRPLTGTTQTSTVSYTYGDAAHPGDVTQMTDANTKVWQYAYDQYGNRTKVTDPLTDITTYGYDAVGRMTSKVSPNGNVTGANPATYTTTYSYDAFGDLKTVTDPLSHQTVYAYDGLRNMKQVTDANQHQTVNTYDKDNRLTQVQRADLTLLKTTYDGNNNVLTQVDGLNNPTTYTYDPLNRKATMTDADLRKTTYNYDGAGNLLTVLDPMTRTTTYGYDVANQLKTITYSDGKTPNVSFTYDNDGQRLTMSDGTGQTSYTMDSLHRLTQSTNGAAAQLQYGYDLNGHLTSLTYPGGTSTVTRGYDAAGRLSTMTDWLTNTTSFGYDVDSNLTTETYPNTTIASFTYNAADQLMGIVDTTGSKKTQFLNFGYGRDNLGQLTADNPQSYTYDKINRLGTNVNGATTTYGYDNGDNLTGIAISGSTTTTLTYDVAHQLGSFTKMNGSTLVQKLTYAYDADGNRTSKTDQNNAVTSYGWDQANRLTGYGTTATYTYNGDGLRLSKTVSGTAEPFVWDVAEGLPLIVKDGTTSYVTGPGGLPLEQISGTKVYYFHQDQLGSTRALTDSRGATAASYTFDAYGNLTSTPPTLTNPFQFAGQFTDPESGLQYLRARYYEPSTGGFLARDPVGSSTRQPYSYALDSPLDGFDPSGLYNCGWQPWLCISVPTSLGQAWNQFSSNVRNPQTLAAAAVTGLVAGAGVLCVGSGVCEAAVGVSAGASQLRNVLMLATIAAIPAWVVIQAQCDGPDDDNCHRTEPTIFDATPQPSPTPCPSPTYGPPVPQLGSEIQQPSAPSPKP